jgi:hypothetical protein
LSRDDKLMEFFRALFRSIIFDVPAFIESKVSQEEGKSANIHAI